MSMRCRFLRLLRRVALGLLPLAALAGSGSPGQTPGDPAPGGPTAGGQAPAVNVSQELLFAGLRSVGGSGAFKAIAIDAAGEVYLLFDQQDGIRVLKVAHDGSAVLQEVHLGARGDTGAALTLDAAGNVYVAGTTASATLPATAGAAIDVASAGSTTSFVAKLDANLSLLFLTYTGGTRIAATAVSASGDAVCVTGVIYGSDLPVTANSLQSLPAPGSLQNGFVESFSADGSTLRYASYITGALGDTTPTGIVADAGDDVWLVGSTSAPGFATVNAVVPTILGSPSGFLMRLTPGGDGIVFSTFVPGAGLSSIALDAEGTSLLMTGAVAPGRFPVTVVTTALVPTTYQVLLRMALDGSSVTSGTVIAPGLQSAVAATGDGGAWVGGTFADATAPLLAQSALAEVGDAYAVHVTPSGFIDQTVRLGGLPSSNQTFASLPVALAGLAVDAGGTLFAAGAAMPTASASLLGEETYDFPLAGGPTAAFPSSISDAEATAATCSGSLCAGSGGWLAKIGTGEPAGAFAFSMGNLPFVTLRNLGSASADGVQLTTSAGELKSTCGSTLPAGGECDALLAGGQAGVLTATSKSAPAGSASFPAYAKAPRASSIVFSPKELDFGVQSSLSPAAARTIAITNLGTASETFLSGQQTAPNSVSLFQEGASDCPPGMVSGTKMLAQGATCHMDVDFAASPQTAQDGFFRSEWSIGSQQVLLTGYSQAAAMSVSANEVDFGTEIQGGLTLPRFVYLANSSGDALAHTSVSLPASSPFRVTDGCPSLLTGGAVCPIRIDYLSAIAPAEDAVTLALDQGLSVLITGSTMPSATLGGGTVNSSVSVSPSSLTFANAVVVTGVSTASQTISVTNTSASNLPLTLSVSGDFSEVSSCGAVLATGSSCAVAVAFTPSQPGVRQGLLHVMAGAGTAPISIALSGTGAGMIAPNNGTITFGSVPAGQPIAQFYKVTQPFDTLTLATTGPFLVTLIEDAGFGHGQPPSSAYVSSGTGTCHNCWIGLRFQPNLAGLQAGTLRVSSDSHGMPYVLDLQGAGIATSGLIANPSIQDFGPVPVNSGSGTLLLQITNLDAGGAPIALSPATVSGDFALAGETAHPCGGELAYAATCSIGVVFSPLQEGARAGMLTVSTSAGSISVPLSGTGTRDAGVALAPLALSFDAPPPAGATSALVHVTNTGASALEVGPPFFATPSFAAASTCGDLDPGASCEISVSFFPGPSPVTDTLFLPVATAANGGVGQNTTYRVGLTGSYTTASTGLTIFPSAASYGPAATGLEGSLRGFALTNNLPQPATVATDLPPGFALRGPPCTTLDPGQSCTVMVEFLPLTNGDLPETLAFTALAADGSNLATSLAYLDGYGVGTGTLVIDGGPVVDGVYRFGSVPQGQTASQTFVLSKGGGAGALPITVRRIISPPPFLSSTTCGTPLTDGETCQVTVTYTPQGESGGSISSTGGDLGSLTIESDAQSSPDVIELAGQPGAGTPGSAPAVKATFQLSTGSLAFPPTTVGDSSPPQTVTLTNTGNTLITFGEVTSSSDFQVESGCSTLNAGAACTLLVASAPQSAGKHITALEIRSNATGSLEFLDLLSTGTASPLAFAPTELDFGSVAVGSTSILTIVVTNRGTSPITFASVSVSSGFVLSGSCPLTGGSLGVSMSCALNVRFAPSAPGAQTGTVSFMTSASTASLKVPVTGSGVQSNLTVTPAMLAFGSIVVGTSATESVSLGNSGTAPVSGLSMTASGSFAITSPCKVTVLAPGASCLVGVTFTPAAVGATTGQLLILSSDPASPLALAVSGTGISSAGFSLSVNGGTSATGTVLNGGYTSFSLLLTPAGSFGGNVVLTCTPVQPVAYASCSLLPSLVNLGAGTQSATATINTVQSASAMAYPPPVGPEFTDRERATAFMAALILIVGRRRRVHPVRRAGAAVAFLLSVGMMGCGGGSGASGFHDTPPGTYQFLVSATSTSGVVLTQTVVLNLIVTAH